jgi:trimeric autotransporter adhesin
LRNTIVADNYRGAGAAVEDDIQGVALDSASSFNLIGTGGSGGLTGGANNNRVGAANLGLEPLANNGGPTLTHALLARSPAIDKGKASG